MYLEQRMDFLRHWMQEYRFIHTYSIRDALTRCWHERDCYRTNVDIMSNPVHSHIFMLWMPAMTDTAQLLHSDEQMIHFVLQQSCITIRAVSWRDLLVINHSTETFLLKLGLEMSCLWCESYRDPPVCSGVCVCSKGLLWGTASGCADPLDLLYHFNRTEMKERDYFPLFLCLSFSSCRDWPRKMRNKSLWVD